MSLKTAVLEFCSLILGFAAFCVAMGYADAIDAWLIGG